MIAYRVLWFIYVMCYFGSNANFIVDKILSEFPARDIIPKAITNSKSRLLFVAGLEGTGHHALNAMFENCLAAKHCEIHAPLTQILMQFDPAKTMVHGLFGAGDVKHNALQLQQAYEQMKTIAAYGENNLYLVGLCFVKRSAMLSYPNYNGINKALDHPDISVLAALAELAGVDFRVLVLQREASEILASTARRGIGGLEEPKILLDNAAALHAQLQLLDRRFFQCLHYQDIGNLTSTQQSELGDFLHPTLIPPILGRMLESVHYSSGSTHNNHLRKHSSPRQLTHQAGEDKVKKRYVLDAPSPQQQREEPAVEEDSTRYHAWQLAQRIGLIERLCAAPVTAAAAVVT